MAIVATSQRFLSVTDLMELRDFRGFKRRQLLYAIKEDAISPAKFVGVARMFGESQVPQILTAVTRTAKARQK